MAWCLILFVKSEAHHRSHDSCSVGDSRSGGIDQVRANLTDNSPPTLGNYLAETKKTSSERMGLEKANELGEILLYGKSIES